MLSGSIFSKFHVVYGFHFELEVLCITLYMSHINVSRTGKCWLKNSMLYFL